MLYKLFETYCNRKAPEVRGSPSQNRFGVGMVLLVGLIETDCIRVEGL